MNRCTVTHGSITTKWFTTAPWLRSLQALHKIGELRSRREFNSQSRGICDGRWKKSQSEYTGALYGKVGNHTEATPLLRYRLIVWPVGRNIISRRWKSESPKLHPPLGTRPKSSRLSSRLQPSVIDASPSDLPGTQHAESIFKRRSLPASPLMDPAFFEAREKHKICKPGPSKTPTEFQRQLAKNPYALALATPVRKCLLTKVKLPNYFLQDFMAMVEPKTQKPWYVPASLSNKHTPPKFQDCKDAEETGAHTEPENLQKTQKRIGFKVYTLNSKAALEGMQKPKSGSKRNSKGSQTYVEQSFIPPKMREYKGAMRAYSSTKWRPDMQDFVSDLMGRRIVSTFSHLWKLQRGYLVGCHGWDDALKKPQVAAFLWLGTIGDEATRGPPHFATLDVGTQDYNEVGSDLGRRKRKVPVFNLKALLGIEKISMLRALVPNGEVVALKHKNATVELQLKLWKLQGYMATVE
ncbi:Esterase-like protein [Diplocarpon rosae]|nr:Esterase-like protein [Diplocarpon rosae]